MSSLTTPKIILDTNVVLDWLVFRDPCCQALGAAIEQGRISWQADPDMRLECELVLGRGVGASRAPDLGAIGHAWQRYAVMEERQSNLAAAVGTKVRCRCTDPDDQPFIDLALQCGARWLLSRDRAVLKLAREARPLGLEILAPSSWRLPVASP